MHFIFCCFYKKNSVISLRNPPHGTPFMRWISIAYYYKAVGDIKFSKVYFLSPEAYILIFGIKWKKKFFFEKNFVYPPIRICMTDQIHMGGTVLQNWKSVKLKCGVLRHCVTILVHQYHALTSEIEIISIALPAKKLYLETAMLARTDGAMKTVT